MAVKVPPLNPTWVKATLRRYNLHLTKGYGQHFLIDGNVRDRILEAARLEPADHVLEVGAGIGTMTTALAAGCRWVTAIEVDAKLLPALNEVISPFNNVKVLTVDALRLDLSDFEAGVSLPNKLVSNLPYNIAAPLIIKYLAKFDFLKTLTVMVQKEIAERVLAAPGGKKYGAYTVKLQYLAEPRLILKLSKEIFLPPPRVESALIKLKRRNIEFDARGRRLFKLIDGAFSQRRKKLVNAAAALPGLEKDKLIMSLAKLGLDSGARAETLSLRDFIKLDRILQCL